MPSVMVAGSTGFLGSHLVAAIPKAFELHTPSRFDVTAHFLPKVDFIIHAAGYGAPKLFMQQPLDTIRVNTEITDGLLECLNPGGTFLFCSSSEVYKGLTHPATEDEIGTTTPYHPRACYTEGKRCGEAIVNAYRNQGVNAMSARVGLTYGPGTRKHDLRVLNQFIEQALVKKRIDLTDDGSAIVPLCYVDDMVDMLLTVLTRGTQPVYNVGSKHRMPIVELALHVGHYLNVPVRCPAEPPGTPHAEMCLDRFYNEFGKPENTSWEDGLAATIEYQRGLYGSV
jgi:UDP-glucuronate decarboxylase